MAVIFAASSDRKSSQHVSGLLVPFLHWLLPHVTDHAVEVVVLIIRKCAHLTEYGILAWLFWRARRRPVNGDTRPWSWGDAAIALLGVLLYAASDEFHQHFVPTREGSPLDVLIDCTGGALALLLLWLMVQFRERRRAG